VRYGAEQRLFWGERLCCGRSAPPNRSSRSAVAGEQARPGFVVPSELAEIEPPTSEQVETIIANVKPRWRLPLRTLEQSGMRVGELTALEWRDVDVAGSRFRIRSGKTAAARRWVAVPAWLMVEIQTTCPPDDRTAERRVFQGLTGDSLGNAMERACKAAGIPHFHPHDLRHRYASLKLREGIPVTDLAAQLGHSKKSLTLDTYSHVLIDEGR
jgi:integrase